MSKEQKTSKGEETKNLILQNCRQLFYENGFKNTTARMIAQRANINLGLLNYYFDGKLELGATVYYEMRNAYNVLIRQYNPDINEIDMFLLSSAVELYLCLKDKCFGKFYLDIANEPEIFDKTRSYIIEVFQNHYSDEKISDYALLAGLSISSIKPALVNYSLDHALDSNETILYYMKQQLHYLGLPEDNAYKYLFLMSKYQIDVGEDFTPIFQKI